VNANGERYLVHIAGEVRVGVALRQSAEDYYLEHVCCSCQQDAWSAERMHCMIYDLDNDKIVHALPITADNDPLYAAYASYCTECGQQFFALDGYSRCLDCAYATVA